MRMSGGPHVGEHRPVVELHDPVYQRLRVHDHVDPLVGRAEQVVGLHHLQALVHEGGGVDRDLPSHRPGGMGEGLLHRHLLQLLPSPSAEGPPARGDGQPPHGPRRLPRDQLVKGGVLGVHRHYPRPGRLRQGGHQLPADHQGLLVGQGQVDALTERGDGRSQPRRAHQGVQHEVGFGLHDEPYEPLRAAEHPAVGPGLRGAGGGVGVGQGDLADTVGAGLLDELLPGALGREPHQLQLVAALADVQRLGADRARGSEDQQALAGRHGPIIGTPVRRRPRSS